MTVFKSSWVHMRMYLYKPAWLEINYNCLEKTYDMDLAGN